MKVKTFEDYINFTKTTAVYPKEKELEYLVFGVFDEVNELLSKVAVWYTAEDRLDELGDVCWYMARLFDCLGVEPTIEESLPIRQTYVISEREFETTQKKVVALFRCMAKFCGFLKKFIRDGNDAKMGMATDELVVLYALVHDIPSHIKNGESLQTVLQRNVEKLSDRKDRGVIKGDGDNR